MAAGPGLVDPFRKHVVDTCGLVLAVKGRPIVGEGQTMLRSLALLPALVCRMDRLTRLTQVDPALDEPVNERPERLPFVRKTGK